MEKKHYYYLDVIRGVSAILIVLYHWTTRYIENPITNGAGKALWKFSLPWGCAAVTTFFVLSGFLTTRYILHKSDTPLNFLYKRAIRLYPTFWVAMLTTALFSYLFFPQAASSIRDILLNFTMLPTIFGARAVDGAYWTLQVELFFYFGVAVMLFIGRFKLNRVLLIIWLIFSIALSHFQPEEGVLKLAYSACSVLFIPGYIQAFTAGIAIHLIYKNSKDIYAFCLLCISAINQFLWHDFAHNLFFVSTLLLIYLIVRFEPINVKKNFIADLSKWFGDISYPLYLIHQIVGFAIIWNLQETGYTSQWILVIPFVICVGYAYLLHKFVEIPVQKVLISRLKLK